jgi:hypothetical protein
LQIYFKSRRDFRENTRGSIEPDLPTLINYQFIIQWSFIYIEGSIIQFTNKNVKIGYDEIKNRLHWLKWENGKLCMLKLNSW